ncbi:MAG: hypothetical protein AB1659_12150, partial [Thermodesulfobacteriota bacterium]
RLDQEISRSRDSSVTDSLEAFKKFIKNPGRIVMSIAPTEPVFIRDFMEMEEKGEWVKRLNIKVWNS